MKVPSIWTALLCYIRCVASALALYKLGDSLVHSEPPLAHMKLYREPDFPECA